MSTHQKKILYTIPNVNTAGSGKALQLLARGVQSAGWEVHIAMLHKKGTLAKDLEQEFTVHEFSFLTPMRPLWGLFIGSWRVSKILKATKPDLIHSFNYMSEYSEALAARLANIPWIFTKKNMSWQGMAYNQWKLRSALANRIIIQNTDMQKEFYPQSKKVTKIPRGVNYNYFKDSKLLSQNFDGPLKNTNSRIIICVANLVPVKGIEDLITAFSISRAADKGWQLWILGDYTLDSDYTSQLQNIIKTLHLIGFVHLLGKKSDVRHYLGAAEVFVLPTRDEGRKEGSPVALLEAMAAGLIVLGSNVPGIRDQLQKHAEFLFEAGNPKSLADKLLPILNQEKSMNTELGMVFQNYAEKYFSINMEIQKHLEVYHSLLSQPLQNRKNTDLSLNHHIH